MRRLSIIAALLPAAACAISSNNQPGQQIGSSGCNVFFSGALTAADAQGCAVIATSVPDAGVTIILTAGNVSYGNLKFAATLPDEVFATGKFGTIGFTPFAQATTTLTDGTIVWGQSGDAGAATLTISAIGTGVTTAGTTEFDGASGQFQATLLLQTASDAGETVSATIDF